MVNGQTTHASSFWNTFWGRVDFLPLHANMQGCNMYILTCKLSLVSYCYAYVTSMCYILQWYIPHLSFSTRRENLNVKQVKEHKFSSLAPLQSTFQNEGNTRSSLLSPNRTVHRLNTREHKCKIAVLLLRVDISLKCFAKTDENPVKKGCVVFRKPLVLCEHFWSVWMYRNVCNGEKLQQQ